MARKFADLCSTLSLLWALASVVVVWAVQTSVMRFYTKDEAVIKVMQSAWYVLTIFVFFDCV